MQLDGLLFREAVESDIVALQSFRNDPGVNHFMVRTHVDPDDLRREWLAVPGNPTDYSCVVERNGEVVAMGFLDIVDGSGQPGHPTSTDGLIGYIVDPRVAGQGIGTATARALLRAAFEGLGLRRVTAAANADNGASVRVLERAGMRRERLALKALWHRELGWLDEVEYALLGDEWAGSAGARVEHMHEHQRFDDEAATWDDDAGHEARQVAVARAIEEAIALSPRMSALDVGGGTGRLSILLSDRVGSVVVTDPSAGMVQVAQERIDAAGLGDRLRAVQVDLSTDPLDGAYDVVWSSMALHHVQDLTGLLRSVAGLLVDGGRLAVADLDEDPDGAFHAEKVDFDGHHGFDRQRLAEQLADAGFAEVSFVDATTIQKGDREFGVFLCTATKGA